MSAGKVKCQFFSVFFPNRSNLSTISTVAFCFFPNRKKTEKCQFLWSMYVWKAKTDICQFFFCFFMHLSLSVYLSLTSCSASWGKHWRIIFMFQTRHKIGPYADLCSLPCCSLRRRQSWPQHLALLNSLSPWSLQTWQPFLQSAVFLCERWPAVMQG